MDKQRLLNYRYNTLGTILNALGAKGFSSHESIEKEFGIDAQILSSIVNRDTEITDDFARDTERKLNLNEYILDTDLSSPIQDLVVEQSIFRALNVPN